MAFTILNHGTDSHRSRTDGEIIAEFGRKMAGTEYVDFLINDGPGSKGATPADSAAHPLPGMFDPFTRDQRMKSDTPAWSQTPMTTLVDVRSGEQQYNRRRNAVIGMNRKAQGLLTGDGWDDNIRRSIATLAEVLPNGGTLNMIGWSRGGVTCLRIANWIQEFLGGTIDCNIFAIDPVAGLSAGIDLRDTREIPQCVKKYVAIIQLDEMRGGFAPQDESRVTIVDTKGTEAVFLNFPGKHNTPVRDDNADFSEVARVVESMAYSFLTANNTQFTAASTTYSTAQFCELYAKMQGKRAGYAKLFSKGMGSRVQGGIKEREVRTNSVKSYFMNVHHQECFQRAQPAVYNHFFTGGMGGQVTKSVAANSALGMALQQMYQSMPESFALLAESYTLERKGGTSGFFGKTTPAHFLVSAQGCGTGSVKILTGVCGRFNLM